MPDMRYYDYCNYNPFTERSNKMIGSLPPIIFEREQELYCRLDDNEAVYIVPANKLYLCRTCGRAYARGQASTGVEMPTDQQLQNLDFYKE